MLGALLVVALAARAEAGGARVRWMASTDPRVTGYHVYMRQAGVPYGAALDAGNPAPAADGSIAYVVNGLTAGQSYHFAVTAYTATALESSLSQEIALGSINPCTIDRCTSPISCDIHPAADGSSCDDGLFCNGIAVCQGGVCTNGPAPNCSDGVACTVDHCDDVLARCMHVAQSGCCQTDADCLDTDACTGGERCITGTCVSIAAICPASLCAAAFCDPQSGCGLMPTPDGVSCQEFCDVLVPRSFVLRNNITAAIFNLRATFHTDAVIDPTYTGLTFEVTNATGAVVYHAAVPAERITAKPDHTVFHISAKDGGLSTGGILGVTLKAKRGVWSLIIRGSTPDLLDALGQPTLALTVGFDPACVRNTQVSCTGDPTRAAACR
ncbi:MAG: fibronectin type III domain-containing protein [Deltaproteobacteria bacterium]|nr:fibronectin type III domain-containing protein [Deltaproteobacteria bacterium]